MPRADPAGQREVLARVRALQAVLARGRPHVDTLSCGMNANLEAAIAEGATLVRIGTAVFGARAPRAPDAA